MDNITFTKQELFYITKAICCYLDDAQIKDELYEDDLLFMMSVIDKIKDASNIFVDDKVLN